MTFFLVLILFVILQRLVELVIARKNAVKMFAKGAKEIDKSGYKYVVSMHVLFFISLVLEFFLLEKDLNTFWYIGIAVFAFAQLLRYWAILSLGEFWNTRIIVLDGSKLVQKGPYRFFAHPNYIAVAAEIISLPFIFSCYFTLVVFTLFNIFVLQRRIRIENEALEKLSIT